MYECLQCWLPLFSRQESWSELPFPGPGDLLNPGPEPTSLAPPALAGRFLAVGQLRKPQQKAMILQVWASSQRLDSPLSYCKSYVRKTVIHRSQVLANFKYLTSVLSVITKSYFLRQINYDMYYMLFFCDLRVETNFADSILKIQCFQRGVSYSLWNHKIRI